MKHFLYVPFTGLGLYSGFRGQKWLKNRIQIFKQFVVPSLLAQTSQNFTLWVSWRPEERHNAQVLNLYHFLQDYFGRERVVFTYDGVCFYDDKYEDTDAKKRLTSAIHGSMKTLINHIGDVKSVVYTIQPSDDCYHNDMVSEIQGILATDKYDSVGYTKGYIANYQTQEVREYNPETNPPFYSIKMPKDVFIDPFMHCQFTGLKVDSGKYKKGTPLPSHEYVGQCLRYAQIRDVRGFLVGTHGENISTHFNIPYAGEKVPYETLVNFGILDAPPLKIQYALRKRIMRKLPHKVQRKIRYIINEKLPKLFKYV